MGSSEAELGATLLPTADAITLTEYHQRFDLRSLLDYHWGDTLGPSYGGDVYGY